MPRLEDQMMQMTAQGFMGDGSPDRLDAMVWALTDLAFSTTGRPNIRAL
jgi:phage terminase large subunit-like protein